MYARCGRLLLAGCQKRFLYVSHATNSKNGDVNTWEVCNKTLRITYSNKSAQLVLVTELWVKIWVAVYWRCASRWMKLYYAIRKNFTRLNHIIVHNTMIPWCLIIIFFDRVLFLIPDSVVSGWSFATDLLRCVRGLQFSALKNQSISRLIPHQSRLAVYFCLLFRHSLAKDT